MSAVQENASTNVSDLDFVAAQLANAEPDTDEWIDVVTFNVMVYTAMCKATPVTTLNSKSGDTSGLKVSLPNLAIGLACGGVVIVLVVLGVIFIPKMLKK